jgi:hypothetical protein
MFKPENSSTGQKASLLPHRETEMNPTRTLIVDWTSMRRGLSGRGRSRRGLGLIRGGRNVRTRGRCRWELNLNGLVWHQH